MVTKSEQDTLTWIESNGGPLILLSENLLINWYGISPPNDDRHIKTNFRWNANAPSTDYDRACDVLGYLGLIEVGKGHALILGDAPMPTTWWANSVSKGLLVRWRWALNESNIISTLQNLPVVTWQTPSLFITVENSPLILFDSAFAGTECFLESNYIKISLLKGIYEINTAEYKPNSETFLLLHKFELRKNRTPSQDGKLGG